MSAILYICSTGKPDRSQDPEIRHTLLHFLGCRLHLVECFPNQCFSHFLFCKRLKTALFPTSSGQECLWWIHLEVACKSSKVQCSCLWLKGRMVTLKYLYVIWQACFSSEDFLFQLIFLGGTLYSLHVWWNTKDFGSINVLHNPLLSQFVQCKYVESYWWGTYNRRQKEHHRSYYLTLLQWILILASDSDLLTSFA